MEEEKNGDLGSQTEFRQRLEDPQQLNLYAYVRNNPLRYTDPRGLWLAPEHTMLTNLTVDGFSYGDAVLIVRANVAVDELSNQLNDTAHYMPGTQDKAEKLIASSLDSAVQLEVSGKHEDAMKALGAGLHTVQDRYSHSEQNAGWWAHMNGSRPDDRKKHPKEFEKAKQASKQYVEAFRRRVEEEKEKTRGRSTMTTSGPRTVWELAVVEICAWFGVVAVAVVAAVFHASMTVSFGDKGPVLGPLVLGSASGSLLGVFLTDRGLRAVAYRSGWAIMAALPCAAVGVAAGALLADAVGSYFLLAFPFIVGLACYAGYGVASRAILHRAATGTGQP